MEKDFSRLTIPCVTKPAIVNWLTDGVAAEVIFIFVLFIILFISFLFAAILTVTISVFVHCAVLGSCICDQMLAYLSWVENRLQQS